MRRLVAAAALICCCAQTVGAQQIDTLTIRAHTRFLADDLLAGRGTGTAGERIAASYISSQLERMALQPFPAAASFLLPIPLRAAHIGPGTHLLLTRAGVQQRFDSGDAFILNTGGAEAFRDFSGAAVFFGQPIHATELVRAHGSLRGKVAVFLGPLGGNALDIIPVLSGAGAEGVILLVTDPTQYDLYVRSRGVSRYFVDAAVDDPVWQPPLPVLIAGPALSSALLEGAAVPPALVEGSAAAAVELNRTLTARISVRTEVIPAANVGGVIPGSDPALRNEYVVYTAHYDHLGVSNPDASGDSIYNGFSDNAAGVAMLLAIAESMRSAPPARSVAFLFFTGEERGLLGSAYLASAPPVPLRQIKALINLDAGAPPAPPISWRIAGGIDSPLGDLARTIATASGWTAALSAASPNSDYWPFLQRGVPSIFIIPGDEWENTSPEQRTALRARWDRYHQAGDHWDAAFPFAGLQRYAAFAREVGMRAARR